jgi:hypothetical protein
MTHFSSEDNQDNAFNGPWDMKYKAVLWGIRWLLIKWWRSRAVKLTTHVHLVQKLRMSGAILPLPHIHYWLAYWRIYSSLNCLNYSSEFLYESAIRRKRLKIYPSIWDLPTAQQFASLLGYLKVTFILWKFFWSIRSIHIYFFPMTQQHLVGQCLLIIEFARSLYLYLPLFNDNAWWNHLVTFVNKLFFTPVYFKASNSCGF